MATNTAGAKGRKTHTANPDTISFVVRYSDWLGTNNDAHTWGYLPAYAWVTDGGTAIITGFDDTNGDDLDIGITGGDDDLFASGVDVNSAAATTFDDVATANHFSTSERALTVNFTTAPSGNGTTGKAVIWIRYVILDIGAT